MESRPLLTINISNLRSIHIASIGGLAMVATVGIIASPSRWRCGCLSAARWPARWLRLIVIRMHREHVIGTPGDDLPMSLGLDGVRLSRSGQAGHRPAVGRLPRLAIS